MYYIHKHVAFVIGIIIGFGFGFLIGFWVGVAAEDAQGCDTWRCGHKEERTETYNENRELERTIHYYEYSRQRTT